MTNCTYDGEAGERRVDALRKKNDALAFDLAAVSRVLHLMRDKPVAEAEEIFRQVRRAQDIASLLATIDKRPLEKSDEKSSESSEGIGSKVGYISTSRIDLSSSPFLEHPFSATSRTRSTPGLGPPHFALSKQYLPDEDKLRRAVDAFFASVGKLFHVFSYEQGRLLFDRVYRPPHNARDNPSICELNALGALGWCYRREGLPSSDGELYYSFARHYVEDSIHASPLRGMRSCALIAMYNIMDRPTVALAYLDLGLSVARQRGLHGRVRPLEMLRDDWIDCKRVWRTLTSLGSWLAACIGVVLDVHKPILEALIDLAVDSQPSFDELVQAKMAELSVLTATILRTVYEFEIFSPHAASLVIEDLERWYLQLPPSMNLERLRHARDDMENTQQSPALFLHLLYLGALLMLFRRTVAQAYRIPQLSGGQNWVENKADASRCLEKGINAAVQSARILHAMRTSFEIDEHCWLVMQVTSSRLGSDANCALQMPVI